MKTKAAILFEINKPLIIDEIDVPEPGKGQVLVSMLYSGICRRQLNEIRGYYGEDKYLPHLLGHEGSGIVEETGEGVTKVKKGDLVVLTWIKGGGFEARSSVYGFGKVAVNAGAVTTFVGKTIVSENRLVPISKNIPAEIGAILGCAVPTGIGIVKNTLKIKAGNSIAVLGIGGVGTSAILGAAMLGAGEIIAVDIDSTKLDYAITLGATKTVNIIKEKANFKVDFAVEAAGKRSAMEIAFKVIKDNGTAVLAGNLKKGEEISIDPFDLIRGKKIFGSWGGETNPDIDIPFYGNQYLEGKLKLDSLISEKFKLSQVNEALNLLETGKTLGRALIEFDSASAADEGSNL